MQRYLLGKLLRALISLLAISVIVFVLARITGDPADIFLSDEASDNDRAIFNARWGLDRPLPVQYFVFLRHAVTGDFGQSLKWREPALNLVLGRFPATLQLALSAFTVGLLIAIPIGVLSAVKRGTLLDTFGKLVALIGQSMPVFWLGILLIWIFSVNLHLLPSSGSGSGINGLKYLILPAVAQGWFVVAGIMRLTRSSMLDVLDSEYVKMARIKGVSEAVVIWKHALKNAAIPVITFASVIFGTFLTGSVITETVFAWPGVGRLVVQAVQARDFPVVQTAVLFIATVYITINFLLDIAYAYLDPRIRFS